MNELALFAGAGGGILGGTLLGWRTVCAVEIEPYPASVLAQRQNDGVLPPFPIWDDVRTFDGKPWRGIVDVVSGGFPCQDISAAGKGVGITGERSGLWKEYARIVGEVRPRFFLVENSPMLTIRGLGTVLGDISSLGYDAQWGVVSAADAGAPHLRERIWIVAYSDSMREPGSPEPWKPLNRPAQFGGSCDAEMGSFVADASNDGNGRREQFTQRGEGSRDVADADEVQRNGSRRAWYRRVEPTDGSESVSYPTGKRLEEQRLQPGYDTRQDDTRNKQDTCRGNWWATEPDMGRVAHGVAARVDRLKAIGNGQVPAVVRLAWNILRGEGEQ